jgi:hypothetical protein
MKENPMLRETILQVVENQLRGNNPPETKETFNRLLKDGVSENEAKRLIGCVVASEIFEVLKRREPFDLKRFVDALNRLPEIPM